MAHVGFRCTEQEKMLLERISGGNTSAYLRRLAFGGNADSDALLHRLDDMAEDLREAMAGGLASDSRPGTTGDAGNGLSPQWQAVMLEMLIMMRGQFKPEARRSAMSEVERMGLPAFDSNEFLKSQGEQDD